jgi:hypothetical protein
VRNLIYFFLSNMDSSVLYQITRFDDPYTAGFYRKPGEFVQVFPVKRVYRDKVDWLRAWSIFGDEMVVAYYRRPKGSAPNASVAK